LEPSLEAIFTGKSTLLEALQENPSIGLEFFLLRSAYWGAIGAVIDGFKPTSMFIERIIEPEIRIYQGVRNRLSGLLP